ncbi:hypothetical protein Bca52824_013998 [Brassica carinata]|uniref:Uncharacterized protein n=1 Tax=Brassica carinata TaxID=52824 RepID=A0A8X8B305_BRACI|nr:hypothetical protein Bca52824_013998 [Brassica carinata]
MALDALPTPSDSDCLDSGKSETLRKAAKSWPKCLMGVCMLLGSKTVCLSGFEVQASQLHQSLLRVRVEPTGGNNHPSGDAILGAIWVSCVCSYSQKLTETDIAIGSGEVPF